MPAVLHFTHWTWGRGGQGSAGWTTLERDWCGQTPGTPNGPITLQGTHPALMDVAALRDILTRGRLSFPADARYRRANALPQTVVVSCDRCRKQDLMACIGYDNMDLCGTCLDEVAAAFLSPGGGSVAGTGPVPHGAPPRVDVGYPYPPQPPRFGDVRDIRMYPTPTPAVPVPLLEPTPTPPPPPPPALPSPHTPRVAPLGDFFSRLFQPAGAGGGAAAAGGRGGSRRRDVGRGKRPGGVYSTAPSAPQHAMRNPSLESTQPPQGMYAVPGADPYRTFVQAAPMPAPAVFTPPTPQSWSWSSSGFPTFP